MLSSGFLPLDQSLLVTPKLGSDFVNYCKFVLFLWISLLGPIFIGGADVTPDLFDSWKIVVVFFVPCCDLHRLSYLLLPLLIYDVGSKPNITESLQDYLLVLNALFQ